MLAFTILLFYTNSGYVSVLYLTLFHTELSGYVSVLDLTLFYTELSGYVRVLYIALFNPEAIVTLVCSI